MVLQGPSLEAELVTLNAANIVLQPRPICAQPRGPSQCPRWQRHSKLPE